jgi:hypothetical protein
MYALSLEAVPTPVLNHDAHDESICQIRCRIVVNHVSRIFSTASAHEQIRGSLACTKTVGILHCLSLASKDFEEKGALVDVGDLRPGLKQGYFMSTDGCKSNILPCGSQATLGSCAAVEPDAVLRFNQKSNLTCYPRWDPR